LARLKQKRSTAIYTVVFSENSVFGYMNCISYSLICPKCPFTALLRKIGCMFCSRLAKMARFSEKELYILQQAQKNNPAKPA